MNTKMRIVLGALFLALMTAAFIGITYARFYRLTASYDGWTARGGAASITRPTLPRLASSAW